jgi:tetratricopeptide (TPR) repeat protein
MGAGPSSLRASPKRSKEDTPCAPTPAENTHAMALKDLGNEHFRAGKYKEAEELYSQAFVLTRADISRDGD